MGASHAKPVGELSSEDIAEAVTDLGTHYKGYGPRFIKNGVDGCLLDTLKDAEIEETFDDLSITNRLHRRVLLRALTKAKASMDFVSASYNYSPSTPMSELGAYDRVTTMCFRSNKETAVLAGVHLCLRNGKQLSLDTKVLRDGKIRSQRLHLVGEHSICSGIMKTPSDQNYYKMEVTEAISEKLFDGLLPLTYTGFVLKNESGQKIGMVCMIDSCYPNGVDDVDREAFLHHMAMAVEKELKLRKRDRMLQDQATLSYGDGVGLTNPIPTLKIPQELISQNRKRDSYKRSASWSRSEKNDMDQFLALEAFGLLDIEAEDQIAFHIKNVVSMAAKAFDYPYAEIIFQSNDLYYRIATVSSSLELNDALSQMHQVVKRNPDGTPFLCKIRRASVIYNQSLEAARTLMVPDLVGDRTFPLLAVVSPIRSYLGSPVVDVMGNLKAVLCLYDTKPRPDIDLAQEFQIEQFASLVMRTLENWTFSVAIEGLESRRKRMARGLDKSGPPLGEVIIVATGVEGYAALWESIPSVKEECLELYNGVTRSVCARHWGYEIEAEEGEFAFAFHDPVDAIGFALDVQQALHDASWPQDLLRQPQAKATAGAFRGLRIRMGIHEGRVQVFQNEAKDRVNYRKAAMGAKSLAYMASGGQILTTFETWDMASYFAGTNFVQPQVLDLGIHVIPNGQSTNDGVDTKHIIQLVPCNLAYDYFAARKLPAEPENDRHDRVLSTLSGRQFPPLASLKQVGASFHNAPFKNNMASIAFVNMSKIDDCRVSFVVNLIGFILDCERQFGGYQCEKEMLVFQRPVDAVLFGLRLQEELRHQEPQADGTSMAKLIKYGCMHDSFLTMGPHRTTGRADYFGRTVNRAARLTNNAKRGTVCFGIVSDLNDNKAGSLDLLQHPTINARFVGKETFKGIRDEFNIYECTKLCSLV